MARSDSAGAVGLELGPPRCPAADDEGQALVDAVATMDQRRDDLGQRGPDHLARVPDPVHGRDGVGAGVVDDPLGVQADEAVAHAGRPAPRPGRRPDHREGAGRDHPGQVVGRGQVAQLEPARHPRGGQVGVPGQHGDRMALAHDRDRLLAHRDVVGVPVRVALAQDPGLVVRRVDLHPPTPLDPVADLVLEEDHRPGDRPHVRAGHPGRAVVLRQPEHQVGERQVRQQLPVPDEQVQPLGVGHRQGGAVAHQVGKRRHRRRRTARAADAGHAAGLRSSRCRCG